MILCFDVQPVRAEVTSYTRMRQKDVELNRYAYAGLYELDGKIGFCIERSKLSPAVGDETSEWIELDNEPMRKMMYYGYNGPADMGYQVVATSLACAEANGDNDMPLGVSTLAEVVQYESPPSNFRIWKVETNGGDTQDLVIYTTKTEGELILEKVSADESLTLGNDNYSLEGAVYGVYSDAACTEKIAELVTDQYGKSEATSIPEGTHYLKEITAPPGYELSEEIIAVDILVERTVTVTVSDVPKLLGKICLHKQNSIGESLQGAEFTVYADSECSEIITSGETDADGKLIFAELELDKIYYVKETKAPEGYELLDTIYEIEANEEEETNATWHTILNTKTYVLPETGSGGMLVLEVAGISSLILSVNVKRKRRKLNEK